MRHIAVMSGVSSAMVWGGATLDAIARLRREQRNQPRRIDNHKLARAARGPGGPAKEAFDCLFLCDHCGYLSATQGPCPACTHTAWIDLDNWAHAEALREREEVARQNPAPDVRWRVRGASLAIGAALGLGCATGLALAGTVAIAAGALLGIGAGATGTATALTHAIARRRIGWSIMAKRVRDPSRWRLPLPLPDRDASVGRRAQGPAIASEAPLRAPFSGRPCVAYEVAVLFDYPDDAWPPTWVLREVRSCAFAVDGRELRADHVMLTPPPEAVPQPAMSEDEKRRFLRERGLFLADGSFDLFESILAPDQPCELQWPTSPADAPPFVTPIRATSRGGSPYRR